MRRMLQGRRLRACLLIQRRCRIYWDLGGGLALPSLGQIFHRSEIQIQKLLVILRHVGGPDVRSFQELRSYEPQESRLSCTVLADNAELFRPLDLKADAMGQIPAACL